MAKELLKAYCMSTKSKEDMVEAHVVKTAKGYMAKGKTSHGYNVCVAIGEAAALDAIKRGVATKDF